jgi:hypothetical protein
MGAVQIWVAHEHAEAARAALRAADAGAFRLTDEDVSCA